MSVLGGVPQEEAAALTQLPLHPEPGRERSETAQIRLRVH